MTVQTIRTRMPGRTLIATRVGSLQKGLRDLLRIECSDSIKKQIRVDFDEEVLLPIIECYYPIKRES